MPTRRVKRKEYKEWWDNGQRSKPNLLVTLKEPARGTKKYGWNTKKASSYRQFTI